MKFKKYQSQARLKITVGVPVTPCVLNAWKKVLDLGERGPCQGQDGAMFLELVGLGVLVDGFNRAHLLTARVFLF